LEYGLSCQKFLLKLGVVAHVYNPMYFRGSRIAWVNLGKACLKKYINKRASKYEPLDSITSSTHRERERERERARSCWNLIDIVAVLGKWGIRLLGKINAFLSIVHCYKAGPPFIVCLFTCLLSLLLFLSCSTRSSQSWADASTMLLDLPAFKTISQIKSLFLFNYSVSSILL
jgi:hypothetical protein